MHVFETKAEADDAWPEVTAAVLGDVNEGKVLPAHPLVLLRRLFPL